MKSNNKLILQAIRQAVEWLSSLTDKKTLEMQEPSYQSTRVYTEEECESLSLPCRSYLLSLEQQGVLSAALREKIIHHAMELGIKDLDLHVIEGITRIVLGSQPQVDSMSIPLDMMMPEENILVH